jgi:hypothetical protein
VRQPGSLLRDAPYCTGAVAPAGRSPGHMCVPRYRGWPLAHNAAAGAVALRGGRLVWDLRSPKAAAPHFSLGGPTLGGVRAHAAQQQHAAQPRPARAGAHAQPCSQRTQSSTKDDSYFLGQTCLRCIRPRPIHAGRKSSEPKSRYEASYEYMDPTLQLYDSTRVSLRKVALPPGDTLESLAPAFSCHCR